MTIDQFATLTAERIPTPAEFVAFARSQGWTINASGSGASLRVPDGTDPLARGFAKMLSREPYRTNVLQLISEPEPVRPQPDQDEGITCHDCRKTWYCPESEIREAVLSHHHCDRSQCPFRMTNNRNG